MEDLENRKEELEGKDQRIAEARKLFDFFLRALKNVMIYPQDNPVPLEFKKNLFTKFNDFLDKYGEFKIQVDSNDLLYENEVIHRDQSKDESIAFFMHRDGIREIRFTKGLPQEELNLFLEILKTGTKRLATDDDLVTLLWGNDFNYIKYEVVDEILSEELSYSLPDFSQPDLKNLYYSEIKLPETEEEKKVKEKKLEIFVESIKGFAKEEFADLNQLLTKDKNYDPLEETITVVVEMLSQEELSDFYETVGLIERGLDLLVETYDFKSAARMIEAMRDLQQRFSESSRERSERLKGMVERAGDKKRIEIVGEILNREEELNLFSVQDYLCSLSWNCISNLIDLLGELKAFSARKMVCRVLEKFGKENLELVGRGVYDPRWYVARNTLCILGEIRYSKGVEFIKSGIEHKDPRVRKEAIRALEKIDHPGSGSFLIPLLDDDLEKIRNMVVRLLAKWKVKEAIRPLLEIIKNKEFHFVDSEEKKELLSALAIIGEDQVIPNFRKILKKKSFLNRGKKIETKLLAIKALGGSSSLEAKALLEEIERKGNKSLREASGKALLRFKTVS
ncbi:MAG: hypothetical protein AMJ90_05885 [candidate division Zixibacteria bacterium SM23_73_2]|nr:MAG: hypothetical protein AMJ90_05885 [candidate division Zixibacteria bacterium SM23_73_2]